VSPISQEVFIAAGAPHRTQGDPTALSTSTDTLNRDDPDKGGGIFEALIRTELGQALQNVLITNTCNRMEQSAMKTSKVTSITRFFAAGLLLMGYTTVAHAAADVTIWTIPDPPQTVPCIDDWMTTGPDMDRMMVTATFLGGAVAQETVPWSGFSAIGSNNWSLSVAPGNTWGTPWTLRYTGGNGILTGISIDGFAAGVNDGIGIMFDRTLPDPGTPGSLAGRDFEFTVDDGSPLPPFDALVAYQNAVGVNGPPVGDEYRRLNVRFVEEFDLTAEVDPFVPPPAGLDGVNVQRVGFYQDTNQVCIPEPASATLAVLTVAGLVAAIPRRRRSFNRG
jgi:hypothetical protein